MIITENFLAARDFAVEPAAASVRDFSTNDELKENIELFFYYFTIKVHICMSINVGTKELDNSLREHVGRKVQCALPVSMSAFHQII